jgi:hypothetical protein
MTGSSAAQDRTKHAGVERRGVPAEPLVRIGHIVSVSAAHAIAVLENADAQTAGPAASRIVIGAVVQILTPSCPVLGLVTAITGPLPAAPGEKETVALVEINLVGETSVHEKSKRLTFRRGVHSLPTIGDAVFLADRHDLTRIYAPPHLASVKVGTLFQDPKVPAKLLTDDLFSKHFIVTGSTGSGKSCALTCIIQRAIEEHKSAHVVILDLHNEYKNAFGDLVEPISLTDMTLPLWMLNFQELCVALTVDGPERDEEVDILNDAVLFAKRRYADAAVGRAGVLVRKASENHVLGVDSPTPFRVSDVIVFIEDELGKLDRIRKVVPYRRLKARLEALVGDARYNFLFGNMNVQDTMADVLARIFRIPNEGRPIGVIDLSTVPHEILNVVVSVIARLAFDLCVWGDGQLPLLLVCEEAHRYAPAVNNGAFLPTRKAIGQIAKEGRKYGISLALVTQRPSELDATILSQCSTAIALRLSNDKDQQVIRQSTYEGLTDVVDYLPLLGDREAIILGQAVAMPMRVRFDTLEAAKAPKNHSGGFSESWRGSTMDRGHLASVVSRWRTTGRTSQTAS